MEHKDYPELDTEPELDLEDILREFSDAPPLEEILREFAPEKPQEPVIPPSTDTVRLDGIGSALRQAPSMEQTQRFRVSETAEEMPPQAQPVSPPPAPKAEPFSEEWEPEYDAPMGEYTPRSPIVFQQKDKLRQLREQLVSSTELRYYALVEAGTANLRLSGFMIFLIFLASAGTTLALDLGYFAPQRVKAVAFCQLLAVLLTALLCHSRLLEGAASLLKRGRFTLKTLLAISFVICLADSLVCLFQQRVGYGSLFCLQAAMVQYATCHARHREMLQMDTLRKANSLTALVKRPDYHRDRPGYLTTEGRLEDFWDNYRDPTGPEQALHIYCAIGLAVSLFAGIAVGLRSGFAAGQQTLTAMALTVAPATAFISMRRPEYLIEKKLHAVGTVFCGWKGVKEVEKGAILPIIHQDLFPAESIGLNGMKFYGQLDPDMVLCYTGSLIAYEGGCLRAVFDPLMASRYIRHAPVEECGSYTGGLSALVDGEPVVVGTLDFMAQMDIEVPKAVRIPDAVYTAVDGVLSGVFPLRFNRSKLATAGLRNICGSRDLTGLILSKDFLLAGRVLREKLRVNPKGLEFPEEQIRTDLGEKQPQPEDPVIALTVRPGLPQRSFAVTGAHSLISAQTGGAWIHIIGGSLGMAAVLVLSLIGATELLTAANLLLYSLLWMIPGWLITQWARFI